MKREIGRLTVIGDFFFTPPSDAQTQTIGVDEASSAEQKHDHDDHELPLRIFRLVPVC